MKTETNTNSGITDETWDEFLDLREGRKPTASKPMSINWDAYLATYQFSDTKPANLHWEACQGAAGSVAYHLRMALLAAKYALKAGVAAIVKPFLRSTVTCAYCRDTVGASTAQQELDGAWRCEDCSTPF